MAKVVTEQAHLAAMLVAATLSRPRRSHCIQSCQYCIAAGSGGAGQCWMTHWSGGKAAEALRVLVERNRIGSTPLLRQLRRNHASISEVGIRRLAQAPFLGQEAEIRLNPPGQL